MSVKPRCALCFLIEINLLRLAAFGPPPEPGLSPPVRRRGETVLPDENPSVS